MNIKPIHTEQDHQEALERLSEIFDARPGTPEGDELEILGIMIDDYETRTFPIEAPKPIEAIRFRMDQTGMSQQDFAALLRSKSRASEILAGKRPLSLRQIRIINKELGIPAEILIQDTEPVS
jgi:HTH-type transcriptional regulator/antitoxin HigA